MKEENRKNVEDIKKEQRRERLHKSPQAQKDFKGYFEEGGVMTDFWVEIKGSMTAYNREKKALLNDYFEVNFPGGYAFTKKGDWYRAAKWLEDNLKTYFKEDEEHDDHRMVIVQAQVKAFSGIGYKPSDPEEDPVLQMPFLLPVKFINEDFANVINQMWSFAPDLLMDKLAELSGIDRDELEQTVKKDFKPLPFEL